MYIYIQTNKKLTQMYVYFYQYITCTLFICLYVFVQQDIKDASVIKKKVPDSYTE